MERFNRLPKSRDRTGPREGPEVCANFILGPRRLFEGQKRSWKIPGMIVAVLHPSVGAFDTAKKLTNYSFVVETWAPKSLNLENHCSPANASNLMPKNSTNTPAIYQQNSDIHFKTPIPWPKADKLNSAQSICA